MSPWLVGFSVFFAYPLVATVYFSFTHYDLLQPSRWIGLANYRYMFGEDQQIWPAVKNTLWLVAIMVPLKVMFAFGVALMLTRARRGIGVFRDGLLPAGAAPPVAATLGFVYLLNPATGPVNAVLGVVGIDGPLWFNDPSWSKPALTLLLLWGVGNTMIIFLAALVDVPRHLYESAQLDGAGPLQRLRWVTLPAISPVILFAVVIGTIEALQLFTQAYVAARSPPARRRARATRPTTSATPRTRRCSTPCCSTSRGSASSTWATRRRWRCCCSWCRSRSRW